MTSGSKLRLVCNYYVRSLVIWMIKQRFDQLDDGGKDGLDYDSKIQPKEVDGVMELEPAGSQKLTMFEAMALK